MTSPYVAFVRKHHPQSRKYTAAQRGGSDTTPPPDVLPPGWHRRSDTPAAREAAQLFAQATQWRAES